VAPHVDLGPAWRIVAVSAASRTARDLLQVRQMKLIRRWGFAAVLILLWALGYAYALSNLGNAAARRNASSGAISAQRAP